MTPEQTAASVKEAVDTLGGAFTEDPKTLRRARELGLSGWAFYVAGRGGALGDVRPDTVAAAMGFIAPEAVTDGWDVARRFAAPDELARHSLAECCRWGGEHLRTVPEIDELTGLAEQIVMNAEPAGLPLFAAWRAMPVPREGPGARAAVLLHLLREHRGGAHLIATRAAGLTPLEAILAGPDGEPGAVAYGWPLPYPPVGPLIRRRVAAEAITDRLVGQAYAVLTPRERARLVALLTGALAAYRSANASRHGG
ncbi:SCO6745 family protein [Rhizomonospora bruguierae]|uniref:SCO6745 family protein n=1 Tax=Rhizomonospora bruguierae TaxID=1581705 RepID=UPI001BCBCF35|nr:hypothetical protein [Micromonospora sp. NBRC 107566]